MPTSLSGPWLALANTTQSAVSSSELSRVTRRRDPFFMALESLQSRAEAGVNVPGAPVVILDEARRLNLSTTPVREALVWLCGYGLIERGPTGGFLAPRLDPAIVRDRYGFRLQCLTTSLTACAHHQGSEWALQDAASGDLGLADHMLRYVRSTGSATLIDAYLRVSRLLLPLAAAERRLFSDLDDEEAALKPVFSTAVTSDSLEALSAYHQRRIEAAPLLILEAEAERAGSQA